MRGRKEFSDPGGKKYQKEPGLSRKTFCDPFHFMCIKIIMLISQCHSAEIKQETNYGIRKHE